MNKAVKSVLLALGFLSALLVVMQLILGQLILSGRANLIKAHQHSGYTAVVVALLYIAGSMGAIATLPTRSRP